MQSSIHNGKLDYRVSKAIDVLGLSLGYFVKHSEDDGWDVNHPELEDISNAIDFAMTAHDGQYRKSGEPYIVHPLTVARYIAELGATKEVVIAALLHDVIEDTHVKPKQVAHLFGKYVKDLVLALTKITDTSKKSRFERQSDNLQKLLLSSQEDPSALIIKLMDRKHNLETISSMGLEAQIRISKETLHIYSPLAIRLGLYEVGLYLRKLSLEVLTPMRMAVIEKGLQKIDSHNNAGVQAVFVRLMNLIQTSETLLAKVSLIGSIKLKTNAQVLQKKQKSNQALRAFRNLYEAILVFKSKDACYEALGQIHAKFQPVFGEVKDYFAAPKTNGYQALHTKLQMPNNLVLTVVLHSEASYTIATHGITVMWQQSPEDKQMTQMLDLKGWIGHIADFADTPETGSSFFNQVQEALCPNKLFVTSPKGEVFSLPMRATVLDFAFHIHTDLGLCASSAKVNGFYANLKEQLKNGDRVEIIKSSQPEIDEYSLKSVTTHKAKLVINRFLSKQFDDSEMSETGLSQLRLALFSYGSLQEKNWKTEKVLQLLNCSSWNKVFAELYLKQRSITLTAYLIKLAVGENDSQESPKNLKIDFANSYASDSQITVASCCCPLPGDNVVGVVYKNKSLILHKESCPQVIKKNRLGVNWVNSDLKFFPVKIILILVNEPGALSEVSDVFSQENINILDLSVKSNSETKSTVSVAFSATQKETVDEVMELLKRMPSVLEVSR